MGHPGIFMESLSLDFAHLKDNPKASSVLTLNMFMKKLNHGISFEMK